MAENTVFSALLGWPGSRPSVWNARQDIPPFHWTASMSSSASHSSNPPRGKGGIFFCFPYLFICFTLAAGKGLFSSKFITVVKCSKLHSVKHYSDEGKRKTTLKFTIKLQNCLSLEFRKQVGAGFSVSLLSAQIHTSVFQNISFKFFNEVFC